MRRLLAVVAVLFLSACSDRHAQGPFGPFGSPQASSSGTDSAPFMLEGHKWTVNGITCEFLENYDGTGRDVVKCGDVVLDWAGENNLEMYPVVQICRINSSTPPGACPANPGVSDTARFYREAGIDVQKGSNKFLLGLKAQNWWDVAGAGTYRIIVAITWPDPEKNLDKDDNVFGYFDRERNSDNSELKIRFQIAPGALCEAEECVETSFAPDEEFRLVLDSKMEQQDDVGVVGIKFPKLNDILKDPTQQTKINVIFERIQRKGLDDDLKCLVDADGIFRLTSGYTEVEDCYRVRTEPFIDLNPIPGNTYTGPLIEFVICTNLPTNLLKIVKWSDTKNKLDDDLPRLEGPAFMDCDVPLVQSGANHAAPRHLAGFGGIRSRLMTAATSVLMPAPLHARRRSNRMFTGLETLSSITLVRAEDVKVNFTTPIAPGSDAENIGQVDGVLTVGIKCVSTSCGSTSIDSVGTARWIENESVYQVNWKSPDDLKSGEYEARVYRRLDGVRTQVKGEAKFSVRPKDVEGTSYLTINPGRTLPIKFFLSWQK
jgi:hypothetical protein